MFRFLVFRRPEFKYSDVLFVFRRSRVPAFPCSGVPVFRRSTVPDFEEPAIVFFSVSFTFCCSCAEAVKTNMAAKACSFQFLSRNARNLVLIRRGFQSVKYDHRKYSNRAVSRSNSGVMAALASSRDIGCPHQNPYFPAGGK